MAMKDTLGRVMKAPQEFVKRVAQARWRALRSRDPLARRVAKLQSLSLDAQQYLMRRTATDKVKGISDRPIAEWPKALLKNWDPKRDFAYAMLHAERLTRILADVQIAEILLSQAQKHEERRELCERWLDRVEVRDRFLLEEITTTGKRVLAELARKRHVDERSAAE
jgi:hypothetical protein